MNNLAHLQPQADPDTSNVSGIGEIARKRSVRLPLVEQYLAEQHRMSAVERFSQHHDAHTGPVQARYYEDLIPNRKPGSGEQYAFNVDLDRCTGCKACVTACRSLNGLDEGETWRAVGFLHGGVTGAPYQQTVTAACHHCVDPGCMKGCPVGAYEKDPVTGIVRHLDDQCIGCQYCTLTCPYEVPQYSERLGIVRKCDMCSDRLAAGEAPACVQACPSEAISIRLVETSVAITRAAKPLVPEAPPSSITIPTTEYTTKRPLPSNVVPADFDDLRPAAGHTPLAVMLVLSQASVGAFAVDIAQEAMGAGVSWSAGRRALSLLALALGLVALVSSPMHLGRPQFGFRAVLGVRTSWLSREILAFGAFAPVAIGYVAALFVPSMAAKAGFPLPHPEWLLAAERPLALATVVAGLGVVACSVMVYAVTGRHYWRLGSTLARFYGSAVVQGLAVLFAAASVFGGTPVIVEHWLGVLFATAASAKLLHEASVFRALRRGGRPDLRRTARLLLGPLRTFTSARALAGVAGGVVLPLVAFGTIPGSVPAAVLGCAAWFLVVTGELAERALFFRASSAPRMPGGVTR
jgi:formate dehydrogenase iron-sulfur subunit